MRMDQANTQSRRLKRGDVHPETGRLFWSYMARYKNGERWLTPEMFDKAKKTVAACRRNQRKKPAFN